MNEQGGRSYDDSRFTKQDYGQTKVEVLMDSVIDLLSEADLKARAGIKSEHWAVLNEQYMSLYNRTFMMFDKNVTEKYVASLEDELDVGIGKMRDYLRLLYEKDFLKVGKEAWVLNNWVGNLKSTEDEDLK